MIKETFTITFTYEMSVDTDTGEILETKLINKTLGKPSTPKKVSKKVDDGEPKLILEENKFRLTDSAVSLMNLEPDSKIVIKYQENGGNTVPVIGTNIAFGAISSGNRLTKSNTVACRGNNHDALAKYGTEFTLVAHPDKEGLFILDSGVTPEVVEDENVKSDDVDFSLDDLIDEKDANITEIDSNFFKF